MRTLTISVAIVLTAGCTGTVDTDIDLSIRATLPDGATPTNDAGSMTTPDSGPAGACASGPLTTPIPGCSPPPPPSTGDPARDCVNRINQLRWECQCLPPLDRWNDGEECANDHAEYDSTRTPHAGFRDRICADGGGGQNECPGWGSIDQAVGSCLQRMWDEGPGEPFSEHGHYINMTNDRFSRVACGFYTTSAGSVWAVQNFQ